MRGTVAKMLRGQKEQYADTRYVARPRKSKKYFHLDPLGVPDRNRPMTVLQCLLHPDCARTRYKALKRAYKAA